MRSAICSFVLNMGFDNKSQLLEYQWTTRCPSKSENVSVTPVVRTLQPQESSARRNCSRRNWLHARHARAAWNPRSARSKSVKSSRVWRKHVYTCVKYSVSLEHQGHLIKKWHQVFPEERASNTWNNKVFGSKKGCVKQEEALKGTLQHTA